jgi:hypothetical protein
MAAAIAVGDDVDGGADDADGDGNGDVHKGEGG